MTSTLRRKTQRQLRARRTRITMRSSIHWELRSTALKLTWRARLRNSQRLMKRLQISALSPKRATGSTKSSRLRRRRSRSWPRSSERSPARIQSLKLRSAISQRSSIQLLLHSRGLRKQQRQRQQLRRQNPNPKHLSLRQILLRSLQERSRFHVILQMKCQKRSSRSISLRMLSSTEE